MVVRQLANRLPKCAAAIEHHGDCVRLIEIWQGFDTVVLVDAAFSGALPGIVYRFDIAETELPRGLFSYSSHLFGVAETVEMARSLGQLPEQLIVYGIEGSTVGYGEGLSPAVDTATKEVTEKILTEISGA